MYRMFHLWIAIYFLSYPVLCPAEKISASPRMKLSLNAHWRFYRGEIPNDGACLVEFNDSMWENVHIPHAPKILPLRPSWKPDNEGINWYRKYFQIPCSWKGKKLFLEFEGADETTDVWVNGVHLTTHVGPYLPFWVDVTDVLQYGEENVIAIKVSNIHDREVPVYGNWISTGGLYRDVFLHVMDRLHITDPVHAGIPGGGGIFVTYPQVTDSLARIRVKTHVANEYSGTKICVLKTMILDANSENVGEVQSDPIIIPAHSDTHLVQELTVLSPTLWYPDHPSLYTLRSEIHLQDRVVDQLDTRIGIRRIAFSRDSGFSINGKRLMFMGTNRVQEYPYVGWAVPNTAQWRDAKRLKEAGFQYIRTSHNPPDPAFLDACDALGLLVMDCLPGFQFIGGGKFRQNAFQNMKDMIRRDRNHPSIILWELSLNETDYDSAFAKTAMEIGHQEFPGDQCFIAGWKFPEIYDVFLCASQHGARQYQGPAPLVISEHGHWDYGGGMSTSDVDRKQGEMAMLVQARNHQESLNLNRAIPFLCGDGLWVGIDFQRYPSGVIDYFRIPKFSYYFFQSQRDPYLLRRDVDSGPMLYIANYWTASSPRDVVVYTNCNRVSLFLNGKWIGEGTPDTSSLSRFLIHPPVIFPNIPFEPGVLKAVGYLKDQAVTFHGRGTPGKAEKLFLEFEMKEPAQAGDDLFFVHAFLIDSKGIPVISEEKEVFFRVKGPAVLSSPDRIMTEAGVASALIRTLPKPGRITVEALIKNFGKATASKMSIIP